MRAIDQRGISAATLVLLLAWKLARSSLVGFPSVAGRARGRRGLVKQNRLSIDRLPIGMARGAGNVLVRAFQRERSLLVVNQRRLPLVAVVARRTVLATRAKLVGMRVLVTFAALRKSPCERHMHHISLQIRRPVTIDASHRAMRANQWEFRASMVETRHILPFPRRVTGLTT